MTGSMSRADLVADLRAALHDVRTVFEGEDGEEEATYGRLLDLAAGDFARHRPRVMTGSLQLKHGNGLYAAPMDLYRFYRTVWGDSTMLQPWEPGYGLYRKPRVDVVESNGDDGTPVRSLQLSPAPSIDQIVHLGAHFRYLYYANHVIAERATGTTIRPDDRDLLLLRAKAEAMREVATRDSFKPVQLRDGLNSGPRNRQPAALLQVYMAEFEARITQRIVA
ncbi:hypothetical protein [Burkholderia cenocepacia]|uniref:hypothetical protein n=1 Tax=Burkholderia cenocepacia TaxID=95486 RepID=UPI001B9A916C|nr:hypothetical protein [Burkholderia cenocepacia]MBR8137191.1 hypothetical protein [Burkholderia cenocepacia]